MRVDVAEITGDDEADITGDGEADALSDIGANANPLNSVFICVFESNVGIHDDVQLAETEKS